MQILRLVAKYVPISVALWHPARIFKKLIVLILIWFIPNVVSEHLFCLKVSNLLKSIEWAERNLCQVFLQVEILLFGISLIVAFITEVISILAVKR